MSTDQLCFLKMPIRLWYSKVWQQSDPYPKIVEISRMNKMSVDFQYFRGVRHRAIHFTLQRCFKTKYMCCNYDNHNHHHYHRQCIQLLSASSTRHTLSQTSIAGATLFSSAVTVESLVLLASCCLSSVMDRQNISAHSTTDQTLWSRIWDWASPSALPTNQC